VRFELDSDYAIVCLTSKTTSGTRFVDEKARRQFFGKQFISQREIFGTIVHVGTVSSMKNQLQTSSYVSNERNTYLLM